MAWIGARIQSSAPLIERIVATVPVGSSSKPVWASTAASNPHLAGGDSRPTISAIMCTLPVDLTLTILANSPVLRVIAQVWGHVGRCSNGMRSRPSLSDDRPGLTNAMPRLAEDPPGTDARRAVVSRIWAEGAATGACAGNGAKSWR